MSGLRLFYIVWIFWEATKLCSNCASSFERQMLYASSMPLKTLSFGFFSCGLCNQYLSPQNEVYGLLVSLQMHLNAFVSTPIVEVIRHVQARSSKNASINHPLRAGKGYTSAKTMRPLPALDDGKKVLAG